MLVELNLFNQYLSRLRTAAEVVQRSGKVEAKRWMLVTLMIKGRCATTVSSIERADDSIHTSDLAGEGSVFQRR